MSKWILRGGGLALLLVVLFPPWEQICQGNLFLYGSRAGHHFIWNPPTPLGVQNLIVRASTSECKVKVDTWMMSCHSAIVLAVSAALLLFFRVSGRGESLAASLKTRRLLVVSLLFALSLPVPFDWSMPLFALLFMVPVYFYESPQGPWFESMKAGTLLGVYFGVVFLAMSSLAWLVKRRSRVFGPSS